MPSHYHLAIIGAGPAGLSAAGRAAWYSRQQNGEDRSYLLLEGSPEIAHTIYNYQKGKFVMAEPGYLELRSDLPFEANSREAILQYWQERAAESGLNIQFNAKVSNIKKEDERFVISVSGGEALTADYVILAIGSEGNPRRMGVPGEDLPLVQYSLADAGAYRDEVIVVVGAGDSAIENALARAAQNTVYILNRRGEFSRAKSQNLD
ncbi:MAG: NAD(P)-binding domain-containing protein, partial [Gammaproteobacteria bacterium]